MRVPDLAHGIADDRLVIDLGRGRDLAGEHHVVALDQGLAGDAALRILREAGVEHAVGNKIGDFVRVTFADGLRGENE